MREQPGNYSDALVSGDQVVTSIHHQTIEFIGISVRVCRPKRMKRPFPGTPLSR